jgi:2-amino-4-hydroxy-6-hydroxymethyldihydropteridine diphosphokinase/dihydropteroate synthase
VHKVILGIGSNIGNRMSFIENAIILLSEYSIISNIKLSSIYKSQALLPKNAPNQWQKQFLNLALTGECNLEPLMLLEKIKIIEKELGRENRGFWSPREIDIDILAYADYEFYSDKLTIPHQELLNRSFALVPAAEVWPDWPFPRKGNFFKKTLEEIISLVDIEKQNLQKTDYKINITELWQK